MNDNVIIEHADSIWGGPAFDRLLKRAAEDRAEIESLLTPESLARLDELVADAERKFVFGLDTTETDR